jgi:hypothetical protein
MIAECAIDPEVMAEWRYFESLSADFGVGQGRLLCEFPSKWRRLFLDKTCLLEARGINSAKQAAMLLDQYQHGGFRRALVGSTRDYPTGSNWNEAARASEPSFDIIVHADDPKGANEVRAGEILRRNPPFARSRQTEIRRVAADLIACGWECYRRAKEIYVVDPFFKPQEAYFGKVLGHLLSRIERESSRPKRIEVHTKMPGTYIAKTQRAHWRQWATEHLPSGWTIKVIHWEILETGSKLHARYILTDFGGIDYNWGVDEDPQEFTQVSLLDDSFWEKLYQRFAWFVESTPKVFCDFPDRVFEVTG